eukprot:4330158-Ditylum_brightwellii.AAC.1
MESVVLKVYHSPLNLRLKSSEDALALLANDTLFRAGDGIDCLRSILLFTKYEEISSFKI